MDKSSALVSRSSFPMRAPTAVLQCYGSACGREPVYGTLTHSQLGIISKGLQTVFNKNWPLITSKEACSLRENSSRAWTSRSCQETISSSADSEMRITFQSPREYTTMSSQEDNTLGDKKLPAWACNRQARQRPTKNHHKRKRERTRVQTANSSAKKLHARVRH